VDIDHRKPIESQFYKRTATWGLRKLRGDSSCNAELHWGHWHTFGICHTKMWQCRDRNRKRVNLGVINLGSKSINTFKPTFSSYYQSEHDFVTNFIRAFNRVALFKN
jgi:hypothetical protein